MILRAPLRIPIANAPVLQHLAHSTLRRDVGLRGCYTHRSPKSPDFGLPLQQPHSMWLGASTPIVENTDKQVLNAAEDFLGNNISVPEKTRAGDFLLQNTEGTAITHFDAIKTFPHVRPN